MTTTMATGTTITAHHGHGHDHDHDHRHHHHGHGHDHAHGERAPVQMRELLGLGISGGLVPCPSALVVLIAAISQHRIGLGMVLILAFSARPRGDRERGRAGDDLGPAAGRPGATSSAGCSAAGSPARCRRSRPALIVLVGMLITSRAIPDIG